MNLKDRFRGISLGIFAGDLSNLCDEADEIKSWGGNILHFDVMDGVFVPQMLGGPGFVQGLRGDALLDVHLMVQNPADQVTSYVAAGADVIVVHAEADHAARAIGAIRRSARDADREVLAGVSLMPGTSLAYAQYLFDLKPDVALVLALDPRDGKPANITNAVARVAEIRKELPDALVAFDGGVTLASIAEIGTARPDVVVSGSAIMRAENRKKAFVQMSGILRQGGGE